ncbi:MAG: FAD:protein FMN transferase [Bulleidia sp.]|nr:FAD:protein FMN transferase [Erysipelotrichaceae bacterium]MDY2780519.1 FAD:protein FMN transferase [Bulleidia sp.]
MKKHMIKTLLLSSTLFVGACSNVAEIEPTPSFESIEQTQNASLILEPFEYQDELIIPFNTTIRLQASNEDDLNLLSESFQESMLLLSKQMDAYHSYLEEGITNIYDINASYGTKEAIPLTKDLFAILKLGKELTILSKGKFNITIGTLYDKWSSLFSPFPIVNEDPLGKDIQESLGCVVSYDKIDDVIELDEAAQTVTFHNYDSCNTSVKIDVGAIAKGYAAERVRDILSQYDVPFLINCGTSSIATYVPLNTEKTYYIGIRDPYARVYTLYDYRINGSGILTTSGDDSNYFLLETNDKPIIRHHILDALTGYPNNYIRSSTVFSITDGAVMDALSTALFNCSTDEERKQLVKEFEEYFNISIDYSYFVEADENGGTLYCTDNFYHQIESSSFSEHIYRKEIIK